MLSDPHLSLTADKPMDIFGARWENYIEKLKNNWTETVSEDDTVVIPGDISWGMGFDTAAEDLTFIHNLPGRKIIGKGNHDYWWQTMAKLNRFKEDLKIVNREAGRLRMSLEAAKKLGETTPGAETVVFLHYPPSFGGIVCRQLVDVMHEYGVKRCFYGHIHSVNPAILDRFADDIPIYCISADLIGFKPMKLNKFQAV